MRRIALLVMFGIVILGLTGLSEDVFASHNPNHTPNGGWQAAITAIQAQIDSFFDIFVEVEVLDQEILDRQAGDAGLQAQIDSFFDVFIDVGELVAEQQAREAADQALEAELAQEISDRQAADDALQAAIDAHIAADNDLDPTNEIQSLGGSGLSCENQLAIADVVPGFVVDVECLANQNESDLNMSLVCATECSLPIPLDVGESTPVSVILVNNGPLTANNVIIHIDWFEQAGDNFFDVSGLGCTPETNANPGHLECPVGNISSSDGFTIDVEIVALSLLPPFEVPVEFTVTSDTVDPTPTGASLLFDVFDPEPPPLLLINEILFDGSVNGDPNCDGVQSPIEDEFVEIVNVGASSVNLTGITLHDGDSVILRHGFVSGTVLAPGNAIVVFGGGVPSCSFPANVISDTASSGSLGLTNSGDTITMQDPSGTIIDQHTWGGGGVDQSIVRSPEFVSGAPFVDHSIFGLDFSPGTDAFGNPISP